VACGACFLFSACATIIYALGSLLLRAAIYGVAGFVLKMPDQPQAGIVAPQLNTLSAGPRRDALAEIAGRN
jgi:hypothetical protein